MGDTGYSIDSEGNLSLSITNNQGDPGQPGPLAGGNATGALPAGTQVAGTSCMLVSAAGKAVGWITIGGNVQPLAGTNLAALLMGCKATISPQGDITGPGGTSGSVPSWPSMSAPERASISVYGQINSDPSQNGETEGAGRG